MPGIIRIGIFTTDVKALLSTYCVIPLLSFPLLQKKNQQLYKMKNASHKRQVLEDVVKESIARLSEDKLAEVFDFVSFLLAREQRAEKAEDLDPKKDPLLKYISGVSHGSLAKDIDRELYGDLTEP
ncbi:hypothetical protein C5S53_07705 [Methanophagales archaeon]|nr:hypothetical protein C5S53_07705 [Methanophagales archaeon]